jgi:hypothetical protein
VYYLIFDQKCTLGLKRKMDSDMLSKQPCLGPQSSILIFSCSQSLFDRASHQSHPCPKGIVGPEAIHVYEHFPPYSDPEDGGSMYLRNVGNTAHIHTLQTPKRGININNEPPCKPEISKCHWLLKGYWKRNCLSSK